MRSLRRWAGDTAGLLLMFTVVGLARLFPPKWKLRRIAVSAEVRAEREAAERKLLARVREIEAGVPWLRPLDVVIHDRDAVAEIHRSFPPPDGLSADGISESLRWDTDERKVAPAASHNHVWARVTRRHGEKSVEQLRRENGVLCMWALYGQAYYTVV
ncbi:hypothetical protein ACFYUG_09495 [Streptomyces albogriseolus]|uniref:hypothetical protein n=1 Tax=Streptomyces albogriseolus TaxID=1887 RepID=UPI003677F939